MKKIKLTQEKFAIIDDEDFERINKRKWFAHNQKRRRGKSFWRACRMAGTSRKNRWVVPMHREILNYFGDKVIDHINGDELDNRKNNLRICTIQENVSHRIGLSKNNTSGYRGIYKMKGQRIKKWTFSITQCGKKYNGKYFKTAQEASSAWKIKAKEIFKKFL